MLCTRFLESGDARRGPARLVPPYQGPNRDDGRSEVKLEEIEERILDSMPEHMDREGSGNRVVAKMFAKEASRLKNEIDSLWFAWGGVVSWLVWLALKGAE